MNKPKADSKPIVVTEVRRTCYMCPSQWEGPTKDGRVIYARYRHGVLAVGVGKHIGDAVGNSMGSRPVFYCGYGKPLAGHMTFDKLRDLTAGVVTWPDTEIRAD